VADAEFWGRFPASKAGKFLVKGLLFFVLFLEEQKKKINKKKVHEHQHFAAMGKRRDKKKQHFSIQCTSGASLEVTSK